MKNRRDKNARPTSAALSGMTAGVIDLMVDGVYKVRALGGAVVDARLAPGVAPGLADECLRERRMVLVCDGVILGALQTQPSAALRDRDDTVAVEGRHALLTGDETVQIRAGDASIELHADGTLRIAGDRLSMDIAALIKLLSAKVELP